MTMWHMRRSPTGRLADHLLPDGLEAFVRDRRDEGMSWRRVSLALRDATDKQVDVTGEWLRRYYPEAAG